MSSRSQAFQADWMAATCHIHVLNARAFAVSRSAQLAPVMTTILSDWSLRTKICEAKILPLLFLWSHTQLALVPHRLVPLRNQRNHSWKVLRWTIRLYVCALKFCLEIQETSSNSLSWVTPDMLISETPPASSIIPVKMNNSEHTARISAIVQDLNKACTIISDSELQAEAARLSALSSAKDLVAKLENPADTIFQHAFSVRAVYGRFPRTSSVLFWLSVLKGPDRVCVRLAIQLGIFHTLTKRNGLPIDAADLAASCAAEVPFIGESYDEMRK